MCEEQTARALKTGCRKNGRIICEDLRLSATEARRRNFFILRPPHMGEIRIHFNATFFMVKIRGPRVSMESCTIVFGPKKYFTKRDVAQMLMIPFTLGQGFIIAAPPEGDRLAWWLDCRSNTASLSQAGI